MDRDEIERQDFPAARRGYDAAAVREHLRRVADEFEALAARPRSASLAEGASTQVRAILEAAESSAQQLRDAAGREAGEHVERVGGAAKELLGKLDRVHAELDLLLTGLKSTAEGLSASLEELGGEVRTLRGPEAVESPEPAGRELAGPPAERSGDEGGARLVALNMALEGSPREDTGRYLAEHFDLPDRDALLDDVYTSAGK